MAIYIGHMTSNVESCANVDPKTTVTIIYRYVRISSPASHQTNERNSMHVRKNSQTLVRVCASANQTTLEV